MARQAIIQISDTMMNEILRGNVGRAPLHTNAPSDLRVIGFRFKPNEPWALEALVESETFEDVPEGCTPPLFTPVYTRAG